MFESNQTFAQFLDDYYAVGPMGYLQYTGRSADSDLKKILIHTESNYYEYAYMKQVQLGLSANSEIYKLLDKKPITTVGNSYKYTSAHGLDTTAIGPGGADAIYGTSTEPTISTVQGITSGVEKVIISRDLHSMVTEKIPEAHPGEPDWDFLKNKLAPLALMDKIDGFLGGGGTHATNQGADTPTLKNIECIDRMISNKVDSGAANHVSAAEDGDIIWDGIGTGGAIFDRSTAPAFAEAQITVPTAAGTAEAYNILEEIDDLMADAKKYSTNNRYIGLCTDKNLNKVEAEIDPKQRFLEKQVNVAATVGGISTRPGHEGGFDVGAIVSCGVTIPMFTSNALPIVNSKYAAGTSNGSIYLIDLDGMYIRVDIPVTFLETGFGVEMLHQNALRSRGMLFTLSQLVCTNFLSQAKLAWVAV